MKGKQDLQQASYAGLYSQQQPELGLANELEIQQGRAAVLATDEPWQTTYSVLNTLKLHQMHQLPADVCIDLGLSDTRSWQVSADRSGSFS